MRSLHLCAAALLALPLCIWAKLPYDKKTTTKEAEKNGVLGHGMHQPFETMFEDVFEELPWHLQEQMAQALEERAAKWPK